MTVLIKKKILVQSLMTGDFISIVNVIGFIFITQSGIYRYGHCSYHEKRALTLQVEQHSPRME